MHLKWLRLPHFSSAWVSTVVLATYILIVTIVIYVQDTLPDIPDRKTALEEGIDLDRAWEDLHQIARKPHPYNSKENERVRAYLLKRVKALAREHNNIRISDDQFSTVLWVDERHGATYFEGSNVLVKVLGTDQHLPSVLFSAHFDSSATAPGATDDGMGTVALISLIEQFAKDPPARTTIFNLNNGEEDELCGSHVFFSHPWSEEPSIFLNLEGAGSGGRPILFRSSSAQLTSAFQNTRSPHGTVTSSDAYAIGLIRSQTDFEVYSRQGEMKGLDVSFYTNRDKYHTMQDTIENLNGKQPLWAILELTRDVGFTIANLEHEEESEQPVYWDILGSMMVVLTLTDFISTLSGTFISMTFLIIALFGYTIYTRRITLPSRGWVIFPFSLFSGILMCSFVTFCFCFMNPMVIYSVTYPIILSYCAAIILSLFLPAHFFFKPTQYHPTAQRTMVLLQYWGTTAILKLIYYQILRRMPFGGLYFIEYFYLCASLALIIHILGRVWNERNIHSRATQPSRRVDNGEDVAEPLLSGIPLLSMDYGFAHAQDEARNGNARGRPRVRNPPLQLRKDRFWIIELLVASVLPCVLVLQLALVVCAGLGQTLADGSSPNIVYSGIGFLLFLSFLPFTPFAHQMSPGIFLFTGTIFFWSTFYAVVCFPFGTNERLKFFYTHHLDLDTGNSSVSLAGVNPYLKQALWLPVQLMAGRNVSAHKKLASKLHPMWYADWSQDPFLNATVKWSQDPIKGLPIATWKTEKLYTPPDTELFGQTGERALVSTTTRRVDAETAVFTVRGKGTKSCHILFDQNVIDIQVKRVHVDHGHMDRNINTHTYTGVYEDEDDEDDEEDYDSEDRDRRGNKSRDGKSKPIQRIGVDDEDEDSAYPMPPEGVPKINLWSREWDTHFEVTVRWSSEGIEQRKNLPWRSLLASLSPLSRLSLGRPLNGSSISSRSWPSRTGRIGCNWADNSNGQLPVFDELGAVLPDWTTITTKRPLLTADRAFSV